MNCKPGDLAIIIRQPYAGLMVEVLYAAPTESYEMPDGQWHVGSRPETWVVKSLGSAFVTRRLIEGVPVGPGVSQYGACIDSALRPLPGKLEDEEIEDELTIS